MIDLVIDPRDPELEPLGVAADGSRVRSYTATIRPSRTVRLSGGGFLSAVIPAPRSATSEEPVTFTVPATDGTEILAADRSTFTYTVDLELAGNSGRGRGGSQRVSFTGLLPSSLGATVQVTGLVNAEPLPAPYTSIQDIIDGVADVNDPVVTSLMNTASSTRAAGDARWNRRTAVRERMADRSAGTIATASTGLPYALFGTPVGQPDVLPAVVGGKFVQPYAAGAGAAYLQYEHDTNVTRLGGRWTFSSGSTTNGGAAVLIAWADDFATTTPTVPDAPCHLVITKTAWGYGVFQGGVLYNVAGGDFAAPLAADGVTVHTAEVSIDYATATAHLTLPDGSRATVTDPRIGTLPGTWAVWEVIANATTDPRVGFLDVWSSTDERAALASVPAPAAVVAREWAAASATFVVVPTSFTDVDATGLTLTVRVPPSGRLLVELSGYLSVDVATRVLWGIKNMGTGALVATRTVANPQGAYRGQYALPVVLTGLTPGASVDLRWQHLSTVASAASLVSDAGGGYAATMTARTL